MKTRATISCLLFPGLLAMAQVDPRTLHDLTLAQKLQYGTVRLDTVFSNRAGVGTAFFYNIAVPKNQNRFIPVIVTCRHVVEGSLVGSFHVNLLTTNGAPDLSNKATVSLPQFSNMWLYHPDTNVDLAMMPIAPLLSSLEKQNQRPCIIPFDDSLLPSSEDMMDIGPLAPIILVGYPIGLMDEVHSLPLLRRGVTASDPSVDYNGKREFVIDAACFPGSSGSPVLYYEAGSYSRGAQLYQGNRIHLMGVLYGGPQLTIEGNIVVITVPTKMEPRSLSSIPSNLGFVTKIDRMLEMATIMIEIAEKEEANMGLDDIR